MQLLYVIIPIVIVALILAIIKGRDSGPKPIALAAIVVVLISCLMVPIINSFGDSSATHPLPDTIYYDDYIEVDGEPNTSGVFEYVKYNGVGYVHATDVGAGKIGNKTYTVQAAPLDVYLFLGQSNAANWAGVVPLEASPVAKLGTAYYFGTSWHQSNKNLGVEISDYSMRSMVSTSGVAKIGGIDEPFGAEYYKLSNHKIYVVNGAIGGTSITTWVPGGTSYEYAQDLFEAAWAQIDLTHFVPTIKSYIWIQGESDISTSVANYKEKFMSMHDTLIDGTFTDIGAFDSALISLTQAPNPSTAQRELAEEYSTITIVTDAAQSFTIENGYLLSDGLHYTQAGRNLLGVIFAEYVNAKT